MWSAGIWEAQARGLLPSHKEGRRGAGTGQARGRHKASARQARVMAGGSGGRPDTAKLAGLGHSPTAPTAPSTPPRRPIAQHTHRTRHTTATLVQLYAAVDRSPLTRPVAGSAMPFPQTAMRVYARTASSVDGPTHIHTRTQHNVSVLVASSPQVQTPLTPTRASTGDLQQPRLQWYGPAVPYLGCCQVPLKSRGER